MLCAKVPLRTCTHTHIHTHKHTYTYTHTPSAEAHVLTLTRDTLSVVAAPVESSQAPLFYCDLSTTIRVSE